MLSSISWVYKLDAGKYYFKSSILAALRNSNFNTCLLFLAGNTGLV